MTKILTARAKKTRDDTHVKEGDSGGDVFPIMLKSPKKQRSGV